MSAAVAVNRPADTPAGEHGVGEVGGEVEDDGRLPHSLAVLLQLVGGFAE